MEHLFSVHRICFFFVGNVERCMLMFNIFLNIELNQNILWMNLKPKFLHIQCRNSQRIPKLFKYIKILLKRVSQQNYSKKYTKTNSDFSEVNVESLKVDWKSIYVNSMTLKVNSVCVWMQNTFQSLLERILFSFFQAINENFFKP